MKTADTEFTKFYRHNHTYNYRLKYPHQMRKMRKLAKILKQN